MKLIKKLFISFFIFANFLFCNVCAEAYLEGDEQIEEAPSFLDGLDSAVIMANWYIIILTIVAILCFVGLVTSNIIWYKKKSGNKK